MRHTDVLVHKGETIFGKDGVPVIRTQNVDKSQFAQEYRQRIQETRKAFNIDDLGNNRGGVPASMRGKVRANSLAEAGVYVEPFAIREQGPNEGKTVELYVDESVVQDYKNYKAMDRDYLEGPWTWWTAKVETEYRPLMKHKLWFQTIRNLSIILILFYFFQNYTTGANASIIEALSNK